MTPDEKAKRLEKLSRVATTPLAGATGVTGLSVCDMYGRLADRHQVLETLQQRYPGATGDIDVHDAGAWFEKIISVKGVSGYVSGYAGEVGERAAIEYLAATGVRAEQFASRVHPGTDIIGDSGLEYSVKSFRASGASDFLREVRENPDVENFVVNKELFDALEASGALRRLEDQGVSVINGRYAHEDAVEMGSRVLENLSPDGMGDVFDGALHHIPVAGALIAMANIGIGLARYRAGNLESSELKLDIAKAFVRIGAGAGGAAGGAAAGAAIGSAAFPLVGTVIGGAVGGILGGLGAGTVVMGIADRWKWGKALAASQELCNRYSNGFTESMRREVADSILQRKSIEEFVECEQRLSLRFKDELDPYSPTPPSMAAAIWGASLKRARVGAQRATSLASEAHDTVMEAAIAAGIQAYPRRREEARARAQLIFGSFVLESATLRRALNSGEREALGPALEELRLRPNYPCRTAAAKDDLLCALLLARA